MSQSEGWVPQPGERVVQKNDARVTGTIVGPSPHYDGYWVVAYDKSGQEARGRALYEGWHQDMLQPVPQTIRVEVEVPVDEAQRVADFRRRYPKGIPIAADRYVDALLIALADREPTP